MTRFKIFLAFGASLLALFWLASPAAAQLVLHGDGSTSTGPPQCSDGQDNDDDGMADFLDPECYYEGVYTAGWSQESTQRLGGPSPAAGPCGSGGMETPAWILPLVLLHRLRGRRRA